MEFNLTFLRYFLFSCLCFYAKGQDCEWDRDTEMPQYPPLIMDLDQWLSVLPIQSGDQRIIRIKQHETVVIACPQTVITALNVEVVEASCVGGKILEVAGGQEYSLTDLGCTKRVHEDILKNQGTCSEEGELHQIGFNVKDYSFYPLIDVCFDPVNEILYYEKHIIRGASMNAHDVNPSRPGFKSSTGFYSVSVSTCYEINTQEELMDTLIADSSIIDSGSSHYLARGHMAPDADFCTEMEEDATYYFINVVPQWQSFNNGNWKYLESRTRDLSEKYAGDLIIWSGPWDILELENKDTQEYVRILLGLSEGESVIPVPLLSWKVIHEPVSNKAVAVIGLNNPFVEKAPAPICSDICDQITWIDFDISDIDTGVTYCCTVDDLRSVIPHVPELPNVGLLTE